MFVNFSNHPSRYWDNKQREASQYYGELFDMPFPQISPNASDDELEKLALDYVQRIVSLAESKDITVHIYHRPHHGRNDVHIHGCYSSKRDGD